MRYRLCTVYYDGRTRASFWFKAFKSVRHALNNLNDYKKGKKVTELSTNEPNERVFEWSIGGFQKIILLDETHPLFNISVFAYEDYEEPPWDDDKYNEIDEVIDNMIIDISKRAK